MADFKFNIVPEAFLGVDTILKLPILLGDSVDRVMLVMDPILVGTVAAQRITTLLGDRGVKVLTFDEIPEFSTTESIENAIRLARGSRAPFIIGFGGLRTLWAAKAVSALAHGTESMDNWMDGKAPAGSQAPLILIPTSFRDPYLLNDRLVVTDSRNRKAHVLATGTGGAKAVIMDPALSEGISSKNAEICILDAVLSCVEGMISSRANFFSDIVLERAIGFLIRAFDVMLQRPEDPQAKLDSYRGAFLAASGISSSSLGLGSAIAFTINARFKVPKANLSAVLLPYIMEAAVKVRIEAVASMASSFGVASEDGSPLGTSDAASKTVEAIRTRLGMLKIPSRLKDFDLDLDRLVETAENARSLEMSNFLPRIVSMDDVFDLIKTAY